MSDLASNPYAPGAEAPERPGTPVPALLPFERARFLRWALAAYAAVATLVALTDLAHYGVLSTVGTDPTNRPLAADLADVVWGLVTIGGSVATLGVMIIWAIWQYAAVSFARRVATPDLPFPHSPGGSLVWWLVPFANLVQPYRIHQDLWVFAEPEDDVQAVRPPLGPWWACWLGGNILGNVGSRLIGMTLAADLVLFASNVASVAAAVLAYRMIGTITEHQRRQEARQG